jgi:hypothetical protein
MLVLAITIAYIGFKLHFLLAQIQRIRWNS